MKPTGEHFAYLDALRESGQTNMYGSAPWLAGEFGLENREASKIVRAWMKTFDRAKPASERAALASAKG